MSDVISYVTNFIKANANRFKNETSENDINDKIGYCRVRDGYGEYYMRPAIFNEEVLKDKSKKDFFNEMKANNVLITLANDNGRHNSIMRRFDGKTERYIGLRFENGLFEVTPPKRRRVYVGGRIERKTVEEAPVIIPSKKNVVERKEVITPEMRNNVFECMFGGLRCSEIANTLNLSERIVRTIMSSI